MPNRNIVRPLPLSLVVLLFGLVAPINSPVAAQYVPSAEPSSAAIPTLRWPLDGSRHDGDVKTGYSFGQDWLPTNTCGGKLKKHNGADLNAGDGFHSNVGATVYAAAAGTVHRFMPSGGWRTTLVVDSGSYSTIYEHVNSLVENGASVLRGQPIATVAQLANGYGAHLHFGVRLGSFDLIAQRGALPVAHGPSNYYADGSFSGCKSDPLFWENFIDPMTLSYDSATASILEFSAGSFSVDSSSSQAVISVTRSGSTNGTVTVSYASSDGTGIAGKDYSAVAGTLTFLDGITDQTFIVPVMPENTGTTKTVNLTLDNPGGGAALGSPDTAILSINESQPNGVAPPTGAAFCSAGEPAASISWDAADGTQGYYVDISGDSGFSNYWNKFVPVGQTSTTAPEGFSGTQGALAFTSGNIYWVRIWYPSLAIHSPVVSFVAAGQCDGDHGLSAPTISGIPSCSTSPYEGIVLHWSDSTSSGDYWVDIDNAFDGGAFSSFENRHVEGSTEVTAPQGFTNNLVLRPGRSYYARVFRTVDSYHSAITGWSVPRCGGGPSVKWDSFPAAALTAGQMYQLSWSVLGGSTITDSNIQWDVDPDRAETSAAQFSTFNQCGLSCNSPQTFTASIVAPSVDIPTTFTFVAHAVVDGQQVFDEVTTQVDPSSSGSPAPSISSVSPSSYLASSSNQTMNILGSNFQSGDTLSFVTPEGVPIASTASKMRFVSASQLSYQFNNGGDTGSWTVTVNSPDNTLHSSPAGFTVH